MPTSDDGHTLDIGPVKVGDILSTSGENPVLDVPQPPVLGMEPAPHVHANFTMARDEGGAYCIHIGGARRSLTAAEAAQLAVDLTEASDHIGEIRQKQGFDF